MEVRKIQITPEDETRLRELLKIHEADVDKLSDDELDAAEAQSSQRLQRLLHKQSQPQSKPNVLRLRQPLKTGTMAILAAAAVMLFLQTNHNQTEVPVMVSKGVKTETSVDCYPSVVEIKKEKIENYLKLDCSQSVWVHLGFMHGKTLHLELSNLSLSAKGNVVLNESQPYDLMNLAEKGSGLMVLVTETRLEKMDLSAEEQDGLWIEKLSSIKNP